MYYVRYDKPSGEICRNPLDAAVFRGYRGPQGHFFEEKTKHMTIPYVVTVIACDKFRRDLKIKFEKNRTENIKL